MDIIYMPTAKPKKQYLVVVREYLLGQLEARALINTISKAVIKFLQKEVIYKQGVFRQLSVDKGLENKDIVAILIEIYGGRPKKRFLFPFQDGWLAPYFFQPFRDLVRPKLSHLGDKAPITLVCHSRFIRGLTARPKKEREISFWVIFCIGFFKQLYQPIIYKDKA